MKDDIFHKYTEALKIAKIAEMTGDASAKEKKEIADALFEEYKANLIAAAAIQTTKQTKTTKPARKPRKKKTS